MLDFNPIVMIITLSVNAINRSSKSVVHGPLAEIKTEHHTVFIVPFILIKSAGEKSQSHFRKPS